MKYMTCRDPSVVHAFVMNKFAETDDNERCLGVWCGTWGKDLTEVEMTDDPVTCLDCMAEELANPMHKVHAGHFSASRYRRVTARFK